MDEYTIEPIENKPSYTIEPIETVDINIEEKPIPVISQREHTTWDSFKSFLKPEETEKEKAKASNALVYSEMLSISPSTAYEYHDEISAQVREKLSSEKIVTGTKGLGESISSGYYSSIVGMMGKQQVPEPFESMDQLERWAHGLSAMAPDLPFFIAGMALGGGPEVPTGWAGAFGLPAGIRKMLVDKYSKGEVKSFGDFMERTAGAVKETIKGQAVGYLTGVAGLSSALPYKALSELATMTVAGKLVEGEIPKGTDFVDTAAVLLLLHGGLSAFGYSKAKLPEVGERLRDSFVKDGVHPRATIETVIGKPKADIWEDANTAIATAAKEVVASVPEQLKTVEPVVSAKETSIKNKTVDVERAKRGEPEIETPVSNRPTDWKEQVKRKVDIGEINVDRMAERVNNAVAYGEKPPPDTITQEANIAFLYGKKKLQNEHEAIQIKIEQAERDGADTAQLISRQEDVEVAIDINEKATKAIGTEQGRALQSRQELMAEDYSFSAMVQRAKDDGVTMTPEVRNGLRKLSTKIKKAQEDVDQFSEKASVDNIDKTIKIIKNEENLKQRKEARSQKKEEVDLEFDDIVKRLNKQLSNQFNVGLDPVAVKLMTDLARNRIRKGIITAEGIVDSIYTALKNEGLELSKREIRDSISKYGVVKQMSKEDVAVALREAKRQMQLISALEDAKASKLPLKSGLQRDKPSDRVRGLQREVQQAIREAGIKDAKTPEQQWKTSLDAVKSRLRNKIVDLAKRLETGEKPPKRIGVKYDDKATELHNLKAKVQEVLEFVEGPKSKPSLSPEQRLKMATASAEKSIAEYERRINEGDFSTKKKTATPELTEGLVSLRKERDLFKEIYNMMKEEAKPKKTPEEIAMQTFKTRTKNQIKELERRLTEKDYGPKPKKEPLKLKNSELELKFKLDQLKREYAKRRIEHQNKNRSVGKRITDGTVEAINLFRALKTSFDLSAVLRQGGFIVLGHPIRGAKALPAMFTALKSNAGRYAIEQEILNRPNYPLYEKSKLHLSEHGQKLSQMEEAYMSRLAERIPGVAASERAYTTYLNRLRADSFDKMVDNLAGKSGSPTMVETKAIANFINVATGRGSLGAKESVLVGMNTVFFAPRYVLSRFQMVIGQPLYKGTAATRIAIAKEYGRYLVGLSVIYSLGIMAGGTVETDPRSSDFGKIRFGNTRLDPMAGLSQTTVLISRLVAGERKTGIGEIVPTRGDYVPYNALSSSDIMANFLRSKLSPVVGTSFDLLAGKDVVGKKVKALDVPDKLLMPLAINDIYEVMLDEGVPVGTAFGMLSIFGMGLQTYKYGGQ